MTQAQLPAARAALVDSNGVATPAFYRFFAALQRAQSGNPSADEIAAINAQLAALQAEIDALPKGGSYPVLQVLGPLVSNGLLQNGFAQLALSKPGDSGAGALKGVTLDAWGRVIGTTDATITGAAGRVTVANGDAAAGVPTIDLDAVADGGGGSLLKFVRDAWGRITGTSTPTTTDLAEGANLYYTDSRADARITAQKGQPSGLATLDGSGKLDAGQLPSLAITDTFVVASQAAMLALAAQQGDVAVRTDLHDSFILTTNSPSVLADWQELETPVDGVASFNGRTGSVTPASGDYAFAQIGSTPTTLAGYGITDAVTTNTPQTITGAKTFNAPIIGNDANALYYRKNNQVSNYTLTAADVGTYIGIFAPLTVTINANVFSVNSPSGAQIAGVVRFVQNANPSNIVTLSAGPGVLIAGPLATTGPNQILEAINISLNGWVTHLYS